MSFNKINQKRSNCISIYYNKYLLGIYINGIYPCKS